MDTYCDYAMRYHRSRIQKLYFDFPVDFRERDLCAESHAPVEGYSRVPLALATSVSYFAGKYNNI